MHILVCVKQVPDTESPITLLDGHQGINTANIKWSINPYDEYAIEQALILKAQNPETSVTVLRVGPLINPEILRTAMAMGADDGILVETGEFLDSYLTAKAIVGAIHYAGISPHFIFAGKKAIDLDCMQVPAIIAQLLNLPVLTEVSKFEQKDNTIIVQKETPGPTTEIYQVEGKCVISVNKGLNSPRYPSLPGIMKAKSKPLINLTLTQVGVSLMANRLHYRKFFLPPARQPGKIYSPKNHQEATTMTKELVAKLRAESKVI